MNHKIRELLTPSELVFIHTFHNKYRWTKGQKLQYVTGARAGMIAGSLDNRGRMKVSVSTNEWTWMNAEGVFGRHGSPGKEVRLMKMNFLMNLGLFPVNCYIHALDGDKENYHIDNLILRSFSSHRDVSYEEGLIGPPVTSEDAGYFLKRKGRVVHA